MKSNFLLSVVALTLILSSCSNEEDFIKPEAQKNQDFELVNLSDYLSSNSTLRSAIHQENQVVIKFKDELAYKSTIENVRTMSKEKQLVWAQNLGFNSLQSIYEQAMIDVDAVDETEASYMAFKEKYDRYLYFPMYKEDMGCYMPVIEQEQSAVSSSGGLIIIGNEVKDLKDIASYADLQATGQAYYSPDEKISLRAVTIPTYKTGDPSIGEIDSGWFEDLNHDRKLRIKFGRKSNKKRILTGTFDMRLKVEISFRKKTWMGWVNYRSITRTNMTFTFNGQNYPYDFNHKEGPSSHDWTDPYSFPFYKTGESVPTGHLIYCAPYVKADFKTYLRGFDTQDRTSTLKWSCQLPGENFTDQ